MNFDEVSSDLNNKNVVAILDEQSDSFKKFGPKLIGKLVGRSKETGKNISKGVVSLTILAHDYLTYQIPCAEIKAISELFL